MKKKKTYLIITTANIPENICKNIYKNGYSYTKRIEDYKKSFELALVFKENFDNIIIIETFSKEKVEYLHNYGFIVFYSEMDNFFVNKGMNEVVHMNYYLNNNSIIEDDDIIVKLSGRYFITNMNILNYIDKYDIVAKDDKDIYWSGLGVHSFYFGITKKLFQDFYDFIKLDFTNKNFKRDRAIEWDLKSFIEITKNSFIIPKDDKIGVITNTYYRDIDCCKIEYV